MGFKSKLTKALPFVKLAAPFVPGVGMALALVEQIYGEGHGGAALEADKALAVSVDETPAPSQGGTC